MNPIERRIPDNVGGTETLFDEAPLVGTVEFNDGLVAFGPAILILFISQNLLPQEYSIISLIAAGITALIGIAFLFIKPSYLTLSEWVRNIWDYRQRPKELEKHLATDGGKPIKSIDLTPDNDTRNVLGVKKLHPNHDAVERTDGTMVSAVQFTGANLDTSDPDQWQGSINQFANFANNELRNDVQLYLPMRRFDPTTHINMYRDRVGDPDITGNRMMERYIEDRQAWMATVGANSFIREYYAIVSVSRASVYDQAINEDGGLAALDSLPGGQFIKDFIVGLTGGAGTAMGKKELQARQLRELERRRDDIKQSMAIGSNNEGEVIDADDLGVLLKEFWEGTTLHEDEGKGYARSRPFVIGEYDKMMAQMADDEEDEFEPDQQRPNQV